MKTKQNKQSRNTIISLLIGDGTISNDNQMKIAHGEYQKEYLEWKINLMKDNGIRCNGLKSYVVKTGYKPGTMCYYTQLNRIPFINVLRRVMYRNGRKVIANKKILNRLDKVGIAIWYMDDGHINIRKTKDKIHGFYIKISICRPKKEVQIIIDYFVDVWNINFYMFHEGNGDSYSLCCGTIEGKKFIKLVKPIISKIPSMMYKIKLPACLDDSGTCRFHVNDSFYRQKQEDRYNYLINYNKNYKRKS